MKIHHISLGLFTLLIAIALVGCSQTPTATPVIEAAPCPTSAPCPECPSCPELPPPPEQEVKEVPFEEAWANSPHNDVEAEAFNHWNSEDPKEVPVVCATCHTTQGYQDFLGVDGSTVSKVDASVPAPAGTITCSACHNSATATLTNVTFPSGETIQGLGPEARCMICHQGLASKVQVDKAIEKFKVTNDADKIPDPIENSRLGFINVHYFAAASTLYGTAVHGGYEYDGKKYDFKNDHVQGYRTCVDCHDSHTLEVKIDQCSTCHQGVVSKLDLKKIRMEGSTPDYDGDGDVTEGIAYEIDGLRDLLMQAMQAYTTEITGNRIVYTQTVYPYFFIDANDDARYSDADTETYSAWTARLLKAAYNYQVATKDPGAYAHGGKYIIQLLYDSIEDLNQKLSKPIDLSSARRIDNGHFAGSEEAFRHWDGENEGGLIPGACSKCHSANGLPFFINEGVAVTQPVSNGLNCATCHNDLNSFTRYTIDQVKFPSGAMISFGEDNDSNLCITCHQGRESRASVEKLITAAGVGPDETSEKLILPNPHYFAAGATLFGADAQGAYMYEGKQYNGKNTHVQALDSCTGCHDAHALTVKIQSCSGCHPIVKTYEDLALIRFSQIDFDGDGDKTEGLNSEIGTMAEKLYASLQAYTQLNSLPAILYNDNRYPYWFEDKNANGVVDSDDLTYKSWTPRLVRAAYNYMWTLKDTGAYAHNGAFIIQILYDAIQDIGGDMSGLVRPEVKLP